MKEIEVIKVDQSIETICCDGGQDSLGHPAVYYTFNNQSKIVCEYCGTKFTKDQIIKKDLKNV